MRYFPNLAFLKTGFLKNFSHKISTNMLLSRSFWQSSRLSCGTLFLATRFTCLMVKLYFIVCKVSHYHNNKRSNRVSLVPRIVSEPLFQSSSQKTTLAQGVVFVGVFETADIRSRMSNTLLFTAISPFRFLDG